MGNPAYAPIDSEHKFHKIGMKIWVPITLNCSQTSHPELKPSTISLILAIAIFQEQGKKGQMKIWAKMYKFEFLF